MIPYSYNMVDMGGIDLAEANVTVVEGLYNRLALARNACGDLILFNWKFADIEIAPAACSTIDVGTSILINGSVQVTEQDEVSIPSIIPAPVISTLQVTENGEYAAPVGVDGYSPVIVNVSGSDYNYEKFILSQADIKAAVQAGAGSSDIWYPKAPLPMLNVSKEHCYESVGVESTGDNPYYKEWSRYTENMYIFTRPIPKTANRVCIDCRSTGSTSYPYSVIAFRNKPYSGGYSTGMSNSPRSWTNFTKNTRTEYGITYDILGGASLSCATSVPVSDFENQDIVEEIALTSGVNGYRTRQTMKFDVSSFDEDTYLSWYHVGLFDKVYQIWWE